MMRAAFSRVPTLISVSAGLGTLWERYHHQVEALLSNIPH